MCLLALAYPTLVLFEVTKSKYRKLCIKEVMNLFCANVDIVPEMNTTFLAQV